MQNTFFNSNTTEQTSLSSFVLVSESAKLFNSVPNSTAHASMLETHLNCGKKKNKYENSKIKNCLLIARE